MAQNCGSHACSCGGAAQTAQITPALPPAQPPTPGPTASINGVALHAPGQALDEASLRQRACTELLRQAAIRAGLLPADAPPAADGIPDETTSEAIEALLDRELQVPEPDERACQRHYEAHADQHVTGEQVRARHVLFAVTQGVDVSALRRHAEQLLVQLRAHAGDAGEQAARFARAARENSNCPTGADGGELGWLMREDCAPEFARELFGSREIGVLPRLVHSRFGLHVVEVVGRRPGERQPYAAVREGVRQSLRQQTWATALRQYLQLLAAQAVLVNVALEAAESPLVQ